MWYFIEKKFRKWLVLQKFQFEIVKLLYISTLVVILCSLFIVNNKIMKDIFKHLIKPPINKEGSCFYERNFGIYFLDKCINSIKLQNYMTKNSGHRY